MSKLPRAKLEMTKRGVRYWIVQWPSDMRRQGKAYWGLEVLREPGRLDLLTAARRQPVSNSVDREIRPLMEAAIARAKEQSK